MVVVENCLYLHLSGVGVILVAVKTIFIYRDISKECELENIGEKIHLLAHWLHRIIECGVRLLAEVNLTVDIPAPHHVLGHVDRSGEHLAGTDSHLRITRAALLLLLRLGFITTRLWLSHRHATNAYYHQQKKYPFHNHLILNS